MNKEILRILRSKMLEYATGVNKLLEQYNSMKASGASVSELNKIAVAAHDYNSKYSIVKSEYEDYVSKYERYISLEKSGGKAFEDARTKFLTYELNLSFKYEINDVIEKAKREGNNPQSQEPDSLLLVGDDDTPMLGDEGEMEPTGGMNL